MTNHHKLLLPSSHSSLTLGGSSLQVRGGPWDRQRAAMVLRYFFLTMFDYVVFLVPIDVDTFTMADWLEPEMMQPANCSAQ